MFLIGTSITVVGCRLPLPLVDRDRDERRSLWPPDQMHRHQRRMPQYNVEKNHVKDSPPGTRESVDAMVTASRRNTAKCKHSRPAAASSFFGCMRQRNRHHQAAPVSSVVDWGGADHLRLSPPRVSLLLSPYTPPLTTVLAALRLCAIRVKRAPSPPPPKAHPTSPCRRTLNKPRRRAQGDDLRGLRQRQRSKLRPPLTPRVRRGSAGARRPSPPQIGRNGEDARCAATLVDRSLR